MGSKLQKKCHGTKDGRLNVKKVMHQAKHSWKLSMLSSHHRVQPTNHSDYHYKMSTKLVVLVQCQLVELKPVFSNQTWLSTLLHQTYKLKLNQSKCITKLSKKPSQVTMSVSTSKTSVLKNFVVVSLLQISKTIQLKLSFLTTQVKLVLVMLQFLTVTQLTLLANSLNYSKKSIVDRVNHLKKHQNSSNQVKLLWLK